MPYQEITKNEMAEHLEHRGFSIIELPGVFEYVWARSFKYGDFKISVRIYSSISNRTDKSREVGRDAIRVAAFIKIEGEPHPIRNSKPIRLGKLRRVNRTQNWRNNLDERLSKGAWRNLVDQMCPECEHYPMVIRHNGKTGQPFYGCVCYPYCKCVLPCDCDHKAMQQGATFCPDCYTRFSWKNGNASIVPAVWEKGTR